MISPTAMDSREDVTTFELAIVVPKREEKDENPRDDCVECFVGELKKAGLIVERVQGISDEFIKVCLSSMASRSVLFIFLP